MTDGRGRTWRSLSAKLLLATLLSLLLALMTYAVVSRVAQVFVDRYYMSTSSSASRKAAIYTELNRFIIDNQLAGNDAEGLDRFHQEQTYISVTVYPVEDLNFGTIDRDGARNIRMQSIEPPRRSGITGKLYPMRFADGIYYITITDNSRLREDAFNRGMAMVFAGVVLVSALVWYANGLTRRVVLLSQEAAHIGGGDLEGEITVSGGDEIAELAEDIDRMRDAIIEQMGNEKRAWEANSELITAMSHDIRTPMTSLIGYLDLLKNADNIPEEDRQHYLDAAYGKSLALKDLTDELFKYFLVFGSSEPELNEEDYDAHLLMMQLLGEAEFDLTELGFRVESDDRLEDGFTVHTDPAMLKRVIDNLISNIKKYADPAEPVVLQTRAENTGVLVSVSNTVSTGGARTESTRIGLRTCEKIMQSLGGSFRVLRDEKRFSAEFTLPTQQTALPQF